MWLSVLSVCMTTLFASGYIPQFNELHPRRLFVLHSEDVSCNSAAHLAVIIDSELNSER